MGFCLTLKKNATESEPSNWETASYQSWLWMRKLWKKLANNLTCNKINANWFWAAWSYYVKRLWLEPKYLPSPYYSNFFRTSGVVKLKVPTPQPKLKKRSVHSDIVTSNSTKKTFKKIVLAVDELSTIKWECVLEMSGTM